MGVDTLSAPWRADANQQLDARRYVMTWDDGEVETVTVEHSGRDGHLNDVVHEQRATPVATRAVLGPRLTASTTLMTGETHRHFNRCRHSAPRFARRHEDGRLPSWWRLVNQEPSTYTIDGKCHRRKVDDHFVGKAAPVDASVVGRHKGHWFATERTERISSHRSAGTIGMARGDVNARQRVPDVRRADAPA